MSISTAPAQDLGLPNLPPADLPSDDGVPLESAWHVFQIGMLLDVVQCRWNDREDFYVGGNMFIYFNLDQLKNQDFRGPDFFLVKGTKRRPLRKYWAIWEEGGLYPNFIMELLSPTTASIDRTVKKSVYEKTFHTHEYVLFDPEGTSLEGFRLGAQQRYLPIPVNAEGRLWSEELAAWIGTWRGSYLGQEELWVRPFDDNGIPWPTFAEKAEQGNQRRDEEIAFLKSQVQRDDKTTR